MPDRNPRPLTRRQRECLEARGRHLSAKEIALALHLSPHTVAMHCRDGRKRLKEGEAAGAALQPVDAPLGAASSGSGDLCSMAAWAALGFGALAIVLTALDWLTLFFSPYFAHLWR